MATETTNQLLINYDSRFTLQYIYGDKFHSTVEYASCCLSTVEACSFQNR